MTAGQTGAFKGLSYAFNSNGLLAHRTEAILDLLAAHGYSGVALTLDHCHLDPFDPDYRSNAVRFRQAAERRGLRIAIETGARYLLDNTRKHWPTLLSREAEARAHRLDLMRRAIEIGSIVGAEVVCFWSGKPDSESPSIEAWENFHTSVTDLIEYATNEGVVLALEAEPGMLVETVYDVVEVLREHPNLMCALDVGHLLVTQEMAPHEAVELMASRLASVTVEDMRRGVHEHLPFGHGDLDLPAVIDALIRLEFDRLVTVELSRDSHRGAEMVAASIVALRGAEQRRWQMRSSG